ncbi:hypothetical protein [Paenibacillus aestuarii]|uniref:Uncharacterized protein n=1 Tax=Paenibacillus aestuarii TaxID=516965 RepID=A0ABW0KE49_9BACL|nr:hypothetical protein [Paenibacillus aestuarii]
MKLSFKLTVGIVSIITIAGLGTGVTALLEIKKTNQITNIELVGEQSIYGMPGTQMLVRTGKTVAISTDKEGVPDITAGQDLLPGTPIPDNHLLLFPKITRGLKADLHTDNEIWITVRGDYKVFDENGKRITPIIE